jgi:hypothetical protein
MKRALSFLAILAVTLLGCKKSETEQPEKLGDSYQPVTKGTYWKYDNTAKLTFGTSVRTMTGETEVFNGKTYYKFTAVNEKGGSQSGYYGQSNGDYFLYDPTFLGGYEMLYLKENAAVGDTWIHTAATVSGFNHRISGKIVDKGIVYVVGGKTYNNVIHTQIITQQSAAGSDVFTNIQTLDYYIAKGIGIIEASESTGASGIKIMEYAIK